MPTIIDKLHGENTAILEFLLAAKELSMYSDLADKLKKVLIMSAASYFENEVKDAIHAFVESAGNDNPALSALVKNKALERQFHTYFRWDERKANAFFAIFGEAFSKHCREQVQADKQLGSAVSAFLELGELRNQLAHQNFGAFSISKTSVEIYELYQSALHFIEFVRKKLVEEKGVPRASEQPNSQP
jgi:hypothetical protein